MIIRLTYVWNIQYTRLAHRKRPKYQNYVHTNMFWGNVTRDNHIVLVHAHTSFTLFLVHTNVSRSSQYYVSRQEQFSLCDSGGCLASHCKRLRSIHQYTVFESGESPHMNLPRCINKYPVTVTVTM